MSLGKTIKRLLTTKHFVVFLGLVLIVNFGYALSHQIKPGVDAKAYDTIAHNIIEKGEYRLSEKGPLEEDDSIFKVGPGYEFFLAGIYKTVGYNLWIIWLIQALLYGLSILLLGGLISVIWSKDKIEYKKLYLVLVPIAFMADMVQLNAMLMAESLFIFLGVVSLVVFYQLEQKPTLNKAGILGLILGILYLVRPVAIAFILAYGLMLVWQRKWKLLLAMLALVILIQGPWIIRNYQVYGEILLTHTTAGGVDVLSGNYPGNHGEFRSDFDTYIELEEANPTPIGFYKASINWFKDMAIDKPVTLMGIWVEKSLIFWSLTKTGGFWFHYFNKGEQLLTVLWSIMTYIFIFGPGLAYLIAQGKKQFKKGMAGASIWGIGLLVLISVVTIVSSRYRLILLPFMALLSAGYFYDNKMDNKRIKYALMAGVWLILTTGVDLVMQYDKFLSRMDSLF